MNSVSWWEFLQQNRSELGWQTLKHLELTGLALVAAVLAGVPLGLVAEKRARWRPWLLGITGVLQTVPSLALLAVMIPLLGIAEKPTIAAIFLYSLLPIVRNTHAGLSQVDPAVREAATALGLTSSQSLWRVEMPLALPVIFAGVRTAALWAVSMATLGAFIGAGGLGEFINRGLSMNQPRLILLGAIPVGLLALGVDGLLALLERRLQPWRRGEK